MQKNRNGFDAKGMMNADFETILESTIYYELMIGIPDELHRGTNNG